MPPVSGSELRHPSEAKFGLASERLTATKSKYEDSVSKVALGPVLLAARTNLPTEKEESGRVGNCEKSTKLASRKLTEICALLKPDLLEDIDTCAKFVDSVGKVVDSSSLRSVQPILRGVLCLL